jgi:hypothetical protein
MKKFLSVLAAVLLALAVTVPAFAQQPAPKGTEGPGVRKKATKKTATAKAQEPKGTEGPEVRKKTTKKKRTAGSGAEKPKIVAQGTESQGVRKQEPKGTEGPEVRKEQKKQ